MNDNREADLKAEVERWVEKANEAGKAYADANTKHHEELDRANRLEGMCERLAERAVEYQDAQRAAVAALTSEREAHAGLRARLAALADEWTAASQREQEFADRVQGYHLGVVGTRRNCRDHLLSVLAAMPAEATASRPPETSGAGSIAPVAAEEGGEQEAGEEKCAGVRVEGRMSGMLCDSDGIVRGGPWHHGTDYECTGSAHLGPDEVIVCANPVHDVEWHDPAPSGSDEQGNRCCCSQRWVYVREGVAS